MPQISESVTINRPTMTVFKTVVDTSRMQEWQPDVTSVHATENRLRVGVMLTQNRRTRLLGWKLDLNADIVDYAPNRVLGYRGVLGRFPISGKIEFESMGGTTEVREVLDIRMPFPMGIFSPYMRRVMGARTRAALGQLKNIVESGGVT